MKRIVRIILIAVLIIVVLFVILPLVAILIGGEGAYSSIQNILFN